MSFLEFIHVRASGQYGLFIFFYLWLYCFMLLKQCQLPCNNNLWKFREFYFKNGAPSKKKHGEENMGGGYI